MRRRLRLITLLMMPGCDEHMPLLPGYEPAPACAPVACDGNAPCLSPCKPPPAPGKAPIRQMIRVGAVNVAPPPPGGGEKGQLGVDALTIFIDPQMTP